jgi:hypothetical protein
MGDCQGENAQNKKLFHEKGFWPFPGGKRAKHIRTRLCAERRRAGCLRFFRFNPVAQARRPTAAFKILRVLVKSPRFDRFCLTFREKTK